MRVAIIDDNARVVAFYASILQDLGHEVLAIAFTDTGPRSIAPRHITVCTVSLEDAAGSIQKYNPDLLFVDHFLSTTDVVDGELLVTKASVPKEKLVGISSDEQLYCRWSLTASHIRKHMPNIGEDAADERAFRAFLARIEAELSPAPP